MALAEYLGAARLRGASRRGSGSLSQPEVLVRSRFSEAFLAQQGQQRELDTKYARLVPSGPSRFLDYGQDHQVSIMPSVEGRYAIKELKPTSRANLIYGLGIPASEVPPDTDRPARERLVAQYKDISVNPEDVAEKIRLQHTMAGTYLNGEKRDILSTGVTVEDGKVLEIQRYLEPFGQSIQIVKDPREVAIEQREKVKLFLLLQDRWKRSLVSTDFKNLPEQVQDYWRTYTPDAGGGTNAVFMGIGHVVAIDY